MSSSQEDASETRRLLRNERDGERKTSETEEEKRARRSNAREVEIGLVSPKDNNWSLLLRPTIFYYNCRDS